MLTCEEAEPELSAYLDGELTPQERAELEAHLVLCEKCNAALSEIESARKALTSLPKVSAPLTLKTNIGAAVRAEIASNAQAAKEHLATIKKPEPALAEFGEPTIVPLPRRRNSPWPMYAAAIAAMLMVGLMSYVALAPSANDLLSMKVHPEADSQLPPAKAAQQQPAEQPTDPEGIAANGKLAPTPPRESGEADKIAPKDPRKNVDAELRQARKMEAPRPDGGMNRRAMEKSAEAAKTEGMKDGKPATNDAVALEKSDAPTDAVKAVVPAQKPSALAPPAPLPVPSEPPAVAAQPARPEDNQIAAGSRGGGGGNSFGSGAKSGEKEAMKKSAVSEKDVAVGNAAAANRVMEQVESKRSEAAAKAAASDERLRNANAELAPRAAMPFKQATPSVRIRTADLAKTSEQILAIARKYAAQVSDPIKFTAPVQSVEYSFTAEGKNRTALLNELLALQAASSDAKKAEAKREADKSDAAVNAPAPIAPAPAAPSAPAPTAKPAESFTIKVELIAE